MICAALLAISIGLPGDEQFLGHWTSALSRSMPTREVLASFWRD